jgi:hypothetical protein
MRASKALLPQKTFQWLNFFMFFLGGAEPLPPGDGTHFSLLLRHSALANAEETHAPAFCFAASLTVHAIRDDTPPPSKDNEVTK